MRRRLAEVGDPPALRSVHPLGVATSGPHEGTGPRCGNAKTCLSGSEQVLTPGDADAAVDKRGDHAMVDLHGDQALSRTRLSSLKFAQPYIWRLIIDAVDVAFDCAGTVRQGQSLATLAGGLLPRCSSGATMPTLRLSGQVRVIPTAVRRRTTLMRWPAGWVRLGHGIRAARGRIPWRQW